VTALVMDWARFGGLFLSHTSLSQPSLSGHVPMTYRKCVSLCLCCIARCRSPFFRHCISVWVANCATLRSCARGPSWARS
jgi:hypothetical protein